MEELRILSAKIENAENTKKESLKEMCGILNNVFEILFYTNGIDVSFENTCLVINSDKKDPMLYLHTELSPENKIILKIGVED